MLYGHNSAGKSSILSALDLLIQSLEDSGEYVVELNNNGNRIQLGDFTNLVYQHDISQSITIGVRFWVDYADGSAKSHHTELGITTKFSYDTSFHSFGYCSSISISVNGTLLEFWLKPEENCYRLSDDSCDLFFRMVIASIKMTENPNYDANACAIVIDFIKKMGFFKLRSGIL